MKTLLFTLLFTAFSYGQNLVIPKIPVKSLEPIKYDELFYGFKTQHFKITIKTQINGDVLGEFEESEVSDVDIANIAKYDIRLKVYLSKRVSLVNRLVGNGLDVGGYYYSSGLVFKF